MKNNIVRPPKISRETKQAMLDFFVKHSLPNILVKMDVGKEKHNQLGVSK